MCKITRESNTIEKTIGDVYEKIKINKNKNIKRIEENMIHKRQAKYIPHSHNWNPKENQNNGSKPIF